MTATLIGKPTVVEKAKHILEDIDLTIFKGHCEKLTILVAATTSEQERKNLIARMIGNNIPCIIKS